MLTDYLGKIGLYHIFPNSLRDPQKMANSHPLSAGGGNLASILRDMIQKKGRFLRDLKGALNFAVPGLQDIRVTRAGSYLVVELSHQREGGTERGTWFDLSQESDGTIRLLAMLTALFQDPAPSLLGLEEPELAIHPGAMAVLADTMKEAALRGQVLVATHSPDLINLLPIHSGGNRRKRLDRSWQSRRASNQVRERQTVSARRTAQHGRPPARRYSVIADMPTIVPVVEGAGDVAAFPELLTRILLEKYNRTDVIVAHGKSNVVQPTAELTQAGKILATCEKQTGMRRDPCPFGRRR